MVSERLDFAPDAATLANALDAIDDLGRDAGGAVAAAARRDALATYRAFGPERAPRGWRHDYAKLGFDDLVWTTGRMRVPVLPPVAVRRSPGDDGDDGDLPALAVENAGGIVHAGAVYLEPQRRGGDPRVTLLALADAARERASAAAVAAIVGRIARPHDDRFTALATAFQNCGAYVEVPDGVALDAPLQLVWTARPGEAAAVFPHTVVRIGAGARATIIERHVGSSEAFVAGIVEIDVAPGGRLDYVVMQQTGDGARLCFTRAARCGRDATIGWHVAELGGALVRSVVRAELAHERARAELDALFFARGFDHVDLRAALEHRASRTASRTIVRCAATERGRGRFTGGIAVAADTHGCDATMRDDALVLSRDAYVEATPALEIRSNDVAAGHAATVGALDEAGLFYVQSRGIARDRAERMVALAFFEPAIRGFPGEALRDEARTALDEHLDRIGETFAS